MKNLIMNSEWIAGPSGGPMYFSGQGPVTFDDIHIDGYRSCSVTMIPGSVSPMFAEDKYDVPVPVKDKRAIVWGYNMRAIEATDVRLVAEFFDADEMSITKTKYPVQNQIGLDFKMVMAKFMIPANAETVVLSMEINNKVTAFTFYAPVAYYA